jgi:hypothetical protein
MVDDGLLSGISYKLDESVGSNCVCNLKKIAMRDPMKGFKNIFCALAFYTAFKKNRRFFRVKDKTRVECRSIIASKFKIIKVSHS